MEWAPIHAERAMDRRREILTAAASTFSSPDYGVLESLTWSELAERCNWSDKTIAAEFGNRENLFDELIGFMTDTQRARQAIDPDELVSALQNMPLPAAFNAIAHSFLEQNLTDPQLHAALALWPYARHRNRPGGRTEIRDGILGMYHALHEQIAIGFDRWLAANDNIVRQRRCSNGEPYLSGRALAALVVALTEGMSILYSLDEASINPDDLGKALSVLFAACIQPAEEPVHDPIPEVLTAIDQRRNMASSISSSAT